MLGASTYERTRSMAMTQNPVAVGVFQTNEQARRAIEDLRRAGFSDNEIGFLTRVDAAPSQGDIAANAATGAIGGGVLGGILGAAASLLIPGLGLALAGGILAATFSGIVAGAAAGSIIGMLTGIGVPQEEARFYQHELELGRTIVTVKSVDGSRGVAEATEILRRDGAYDATMREAIVNAPPELRPQANMEPPGNDLENLGGR